MKNKKAPKKKYIVIYRMCMYCMTKKVKTGKKATKRGKKSKK